MEDGRMTHPARCSSSYALNHAIIHPPITGYGSNRRKIRLNAEMSIPEKSIESETK